MLFKKLKEKIFKKKDFKKNNVLYSDLLLKSSTNLKQKLSSINYLETVENIEERLEEILISWDVSYKTSRYIISCLNKRIKNKKNNKKVLENLTDILIEITSKAYENHTLNKEKMLVIVGINGVGKTTTIAKLAYYYYKKNLATIVIAGDTYRSGAVEQISSWCQDYEIPCYIPQNNQKEPASVVYSGINYASEYKYDLIICDTSGRMHVNVNLMNELKKVESIIKRKNIEYNTYLIIDATIGQNSINQIEEFRKYVKIDGIILTKVDGLAKGGAIINISQEFGIPIKFICFGEKISDIKPFDYEIYLYNLLKDIEK